MSNSNLLAFEAISNFIKCLSEIFGDKQLSLAMYNRLITRTTLSHSAAIKKHVDAFKTFCIINAKQLLEQMRS